MRILAFGGSLRTGSLNRALLVEAARLAPEGTDIDVSLLSLIGELPLFNEDLVILGTPEAASRLKEALRAADGLLIASPEYNWGIPGYLKNALDWVSRPPADLPGVFGDLPVALVGAGGFAGTRFAQTAWLTVFRYLKVRPWFGETLFIERCSERFDKEGRLVDDETRDRLRKLIRGFAEFCIEQPRRRPPG
jgi:NAD(P)H-dependent FMN reductase